MNPYKPQTLRYADTIWRAIGAGLWVALAVLAPALPAQTVLAHSNAVAQADQGLNGGWAIDDAGHITFVHSLTSSLGAMHDAGAGWVRIVFRLGGCYPNWTSRGCDGRTALQAYDEVVASIRGQNLHVLGILTSESWLGSQNDWVANNAETAGGNGDNAFAQGFAQGAAAVVAQHFVGQVVDWEVWNEPNAWTDTDGVGHFWGSSYMYPSNYAWLLRRSYTAIKNAQPSARVLFGSLFAHESFGVQTMVQVNGKSQRVTKRGDMPGARRPAPRAAALTIRLATACASNAPAGADSGASYLCATYAVGLGYASWAAGAYPFEDVGQHLYLGLGTTVSGATVSTYLQDLRQAYLAYEGSSTSKRTLVTEVGWPTDQVSPQVQADNLRIAFQTLRNTSFVGRSFWFNTQDAPEAGLYYGLVDTNGSAKQAFAAFQQYATYQASPPPPAPTGFVQPLSQPQRLADSRTNGGPIATNTSRCFSVAGQAGVPPDAAGVILNVTAVGYGSQGWVTVYPAGQPVPATSTLNFDTSEYAMADGTIMRLGSGGQVCVSVGTVNSSPGSSHVILDATGFLTSSALAQMPMLSSPQRVIDTRTSGGAIGTGQTRCFAMAGAAGVPVDAAAVVLNVTAVGYGARGWLSVYPNGQGVPATSTVNFDTTEYAIANASIMRLGTGGQVCVNVGTINSVAGSSHVVIDVTGYITSTGLQQLPLLTSPQRLVDTRFTSGPIGSGGSRCFSVAGQAGIPGDAAGVIINVTAVGFGARGWVTVFPSGQAVPATSTLNFDPTEYAMANGAIIRLGDGGSICAAVGTVSSAPGSSQVLIDVVGSVAP
ncbi:MAG TPA: hypothetical protein VGQ62_04440 [Chloroflexota bacterium]|nr:hypothetical protein [Chloroflexota bacterium]